MKEMEESQRQAELEHEQRIRGLEVEMSGLEFTLRERKREVKQRQRRHEVVQSACKTEDGKTQERPVFSIRDGVNGWSECQNRKKKKTDKGKEEKKRSKDK